MHNNFFKKTIIISLFIIFIFLILFCIYKCNLKQDTQSSSTSSNLESQPEKEDKKVETQETHFQINSKLTTSSEERPKEIRDIEILESENPKVINEKKIEIKETKKIPLLDSLDPHEAINKWKRDYNLHNYVGKCIKKEEKIQNNINNNELSNNIEFSYFVDTILNIFETEDTIYHITCQNNKLKENLFIEYKNELIKWIQNCPIQKYVNYSLEQIKDKFGTPSKYIYDEEGNEINYEYKPQETFYFLWFLKNLKKKNCILIIVTVLKMVNVIIVLIIIIII